MKVILAGYSKTGTKTINAALTELGYNVYDFLDHFWFHGKDWLRILQEGGTIEDFKRMYQDVDAVVDTPSYLFWEEISQAFPEAKIIFTSRDEDIWADRMEKQLRRSKKLSTIFVFIAEFSPLCSRYMKYCQSYMPLCFAASIPSAWQGVTPNKILLKKRFKEHNLYVLQNAPKDRLLIYDVKEGWEPLCKFLDKKIPSTAFPWKNKDGSEIDLMMERHQFGKQLRKEIMVASSFLAAFFCVILYFVCNLF